MKRGLLYILCTFPLYDDIYLYPVQDVDEKASYDPFPRSDYMKKFKGKIVKAGHYPPPDRCILELVNTQLMVCTLCFHICLLVCL